MHLLQFSTSHYCRKARLALGYKQIPYAVENLTPGIHALRLLPLTGCATVPVLIPEPVNAPQIAIADSTAILTFLDQQVPDPKLSPEEPELKVQADLLEDWLDESIGTATRFVYYQFRATEGRFLDTSPFSQVLIQIVRRQYGISAAMARRAAQRLQLAFEVLEPYWRSGQPLLGQQLCRADLAAAALLSPLALIPSYRQQFPWVFEQIAQIHHACHETLPPGLSNGC